MRALPSPFRTTHASCSCSRRQNSRWLSGGTRGIQRCCQPGRPQPQICVPTFHAQVDSLKQHATDATKQLGAQSKTLHSQVCSALIFVGRCKHNWAKDLRGTVQAH